MIGAGAFGCAVNEGARTWHGVANGPRDRRCPIRMTHLCHGIVWLLVAMHRDLVSASAGLAHRGMLGVSRAPGCPEAPALANSSCILNHYDF